jgi:hypothetical protein
LVVMNSVSTASSSAVTLTSKCFNLESLMYKSSLRFLLTRSLNSCL